MATQFNFVPAPPDTLPKDGWQFAAQTLMLLKSAYEAAHVTTERFTERLEMAEQYRIFDRLPTPEQPYGSLDAMLQAEIGASKDEAIKKKLEGHGGARKSGEHQPEDLRLKYGSNEYWTARLERDRPDILEAFNRGEYRNLHQATIETGFRERKVKIPLHPQRAAGIIKKHFNEEQIIELIEYLVTKMTKARSA